MPGAPVKAGNATPERQVVLRYARPDPMIHQPPHGEILEPIVFQRMKAGHPRQKGISKMAVGDDGAAILQEACDLIGAASKEPLIDVHADQQ